MANRWSEEGVCWVLSWRGRGRGSGKVGWMGWVLNCRGSDWLAVGLIGLPWEEGNGRVFVKGKAWKEKAESGRQWVYDVFGFGFIVFGFIIIFLMQC